MANQVPLRCACGKVRGLATHVAKDTGNRIVCYCDDCQAFAHYLGRGEVLDDAGGTDIFQMAPANLRIDEGAEHLLCVRLSEKGMLRWYTDCCRTPVGNMLGARFPFIGLIHSFMDHSGGPSRDDVLGQPLAWVQAKFAVGSVPASAHKTMPIGLLGRCARLILGWWIGGKATPSPFVDQTKALRSTPRVLAATERRALAGRGAEAPASIAAKERAT